MANPRPRPKGNRRSISEGAEKGGVNAPPTTARPPGVPGATKPLPKVSLTDHETIRDYLLDQMDSDPRLKDALTVGKTHEFANASDFYIELADGSRFVIEATEWEEGMHDDDD
jgi:hypothetical protein